MEKLSGYILSVVSAAVITGILNSFLDQKSAQAALIRLMGGLLLCFVVISPAARLDFSRVEEFFEEYSLMGEAAAASGDNLAREELESIIKAEVEAYILDKAAQYQGTLSVEVTLSTDGMAVPVGVKLQGDISPYGKIQLQQMMETDLGIAKENQVWNG